MFRKSILAVASLGLITALALPAFAENNGGLNNGFDKSERNASATAVVVADKIVCVGAAVNTRETALSAAMTTFTGATNAAYAARGIALKAAYTQATMSTVKAAVKAAWSAFNTSMKTARRAWQKSKNDAWKAYRTAAVACKAPAGVGDGFNSESEFNGN